MIRHLMITISEDPRALNSVRFVGRLFSGKNNIKLTFLYIAPRAPGTDPGEAPADAGELAVQARKKMQTGKNALEAAKKEGLRSGFQEKQIALKLQTARVSKVTDIVHEGERGQYDAVLLGPRGLSWFEAALDQSVSRELLGREMTFPLWICRNPGEGRRNLLLCLDGSDTAYRAADHAGFILADQPNHRVTLLCVVKSGELTGDAEAVFSRAQECLAANGLPKERVERKVDVASNVAKAVLQEVSAGGYAAVALGRIGLGRGRMDRLFYGSVCDRLSRELKGAALWICH